MRLPDEPWTPFELVHDLGVIPGAVTIVAGPASASLLRAEGRWDESVITLRSGPDGDVIILIHVAALLESAG